MDLRIRPGQVFRPAAPASGGQVAGPAGFRVPAPASNGAAVATTALAGAAMAGLVGATASPRDQLARRRGGALLRGLDGLQRDILAGKANPAVMQQLAGLLEGEDGEDPALADTLQGLALRARIELAKRGMNRGGAKGSEE
jgi:hypothetical protein